MNLSSIPRASADPVRVRVRVLGRLELCVDGRRLAMLPGALRVLAFLAAQRRIAPRPVVAAALWPEATASGAGSRLRSTLSLLACSAGAAIVETSSGLRLSDDVEVDLRSSRATALLLVAGGAPVDQADVIEILSDDLLPGWNEDWALLEAERWHHLRRQALEALAARLTGEGDTVGASRAALAAIRADPFRESSRANLINALLAAGDRPEAIAELGRYRVVLNRHLGLEPSGQLYRLVFTPSGEAQAARHDPTPVAPVIRSTRPT